MKMVAERGPVMVTGGAGFIGSQICKILAASNKQVVIFDLRSAREMENIRMCRGDIANLHDLIGCVKKHDVEGIISTAAILPPDDVRNPYKTFQVNVGGLVNVLEITRIFDLKRLIFISTAGVYGKSYDLKTISEDKPMNPEIYYEKTKMMGEQLCKTYMERYDLDVGIVRFPFVYGPKQHDIWPLNILLYYALKGEALRVSQGADYVMDYLHVKDAARGSILAYYAKSLPNVVYNIGLGRLVSVSEIADVIKEMLPSFDCVIGHGPWPSELHQSWIRGPLDISRAKFDFGYEPGYEVREGVRDLVEWLQKNPSEYETWPSNDLWVVK